MPRTFTHPAEERPEDRLHQMHYSRQGNDDVVCRHCHAHNSIIANYTETGYGTASVVNRDGETDNHEIHDYDNFDVSEYVCSECDREERSLDNLILSEREMTEEEEEDEED